MQWLREANRLYNLEEPTAETDSTALQLYLNVSKSATGRADEAVAIESLIKAGNIHQGYQRYAEANGLYHHALGLIGNRPDMKAFRYEACLYLGSSMYFSNVLDSAGYFFKEASAIENRYDRKDLLPEKDRLYNSLGALYFEAANYQQARNYFQKALDFSSTATTDYLEMYNGIQSNIASCLMKLNRYDSALAILTALKPSAYQENLIRQNTAHCLFELGRYDSALGIYGTLPLQEDYTSVVALTDIGRIYMQKRQWQKAEIVFDSAIAHNKTFSRAVRNKEEALAYLYRAMLAGEQGLVDEALGWTNEALRELHGDFQARDLQDLPQKISGSVSPITSFQVLHTRAGFLKQKYRRSGQKQILFASMRAYRKALETAQFIRMNFDNDEATLFFNGNNRRIFTEAIETAFEAYQADKKLAGEFLFVLESYKGNVLFQNFRNLAIRSRAGIPDSVLSKEKDLRQLIGLYTSRLNQSSGEKDALQLQKKLLDLEVELSRLQQSFEKDPTYAFHKYQQLPESFRIEQVQASLDDHTAILDYYLADSAAYCLVLRQHTLDIRRLPLSPAFFTDVENFIRETYDPVEGARYTGYAAAAGLHAALVTPIEDIAGPAEKWVIVPDGKLYTIPFESLLKNESEKDFLLHSKIISYHYSVALLLDAGNHENNQRKQRSALGFAPYAEMDSIIRGSGLPVLPSSIGEIKGMAGATFTASKATLQAFLQEAPKHSLVHLATHASVGRDSSSNWVQFYPDAENPGGGRLGIHEIYALDLRRAELLVLSACETGGGLQVAGEGLISLSRAFLYAGADGIVSTLWKTEDRVTAYIMQRLHHYLDEGYGAEKALVLAKRDLLKNQSLGVRYHAPSYWANFIYTGKLQDHHRPHNGFKTVGWILAAVTLLFAGMQFRKKKAPSS